MSRPPYPHRCLGGDPFVWACRCKATPDIYSAETARNGWGSGCPIALRERIAEQDRHISSLDCRFAGHVAELSGKHCPPGQPCDRCEAESRAERAEAERDAAMARCGLLESDVSVLDRCVKDACAYLRVTDDDDSDWPKLPAAVAAMAKDLTALRTYLTRSVADDTTIHEAWNILHNLAPEDLSLVLKWADEIDGRPKKPVQIPAVLFHRLLSAGLKDADGDVLEWITARVERCAEVEAENANLEDMTDRLDRQAAGMTEAFERLEAEALRLRDLVRHQRGPLHDAELLTDEEYADLAADAGAVARLRGYDELRRESRADVDKAVAAAMEARAKEIEEAADQRDVDGDLADKDIAEAMRLAARIVRGT